MCEYVVCGSVFKRKEGERVRVQRGIFSMEQGEEKKQTWESGMNGSMNEMPWSMNTGVIFLPLSLEFIC